jgi:hypothetical protein
MHRRGQRRSYVRHARFHLTKSDRQRFMAVIILIAAALLAIVISRPF